MKFQTTLILAGSESLSRIPEGSVIGGQVEQVDAFVGVRVLTTDYDWKLTDSPPVESSSMSELSFSVVDMESDLYRYQSFEDPSQFIHMKPQKMHRRSKAECKSPSNKKLRSDPNNLLIASASFHNYYDGISSNWFPYLVRASFVSVTNVSFRSFKLKRRRLL
jgi:hypothetical protein